MAEGTGRRGRAEAAQRPSLARKLARYAALDTSEKLLVAEAWARLALARLFARRIPAQHPREPARGAITSSARDLAQLERLFLVAARHHPGAVSCIPRSRALVAFLRRSGHDARLRVGLRRTAAGALEGHAWAEVEGRAVGEAAAVAAFVPLGR